MAGERDEAVRLRKTYAAEQDRIRGDKRLSEAQRQRALARAYQSARARMNELKAQEAERLPRLQRQLERELFDHSAVSESWFDATDAISVRDAQDRAARLASPQEAMEAMRRAEDTDDVVLAGAVARRAAMQARASWGGRARAWQQVADQYVEAMDHGSIADELAEARAAQADRDPMAFSLMRPTGLNPYYENTADDDGGDGGTEGAA